jgi:hypothetical protein
MIATSPKVPDAQNTECCLGSTGVACAALKDDAVTVNTGLPEPVTLLGVTAQVVLVNADDIVQVTATFPENPFRADIVKLSVAELPRAILIVAFAAEN